MIDNGVRDRLALLGRQLGVRIEAAHATTPRPGVIRLAEFEVCSAESPDAFVTCDRVEIYSGSKPRLIVGDVVLDTSRVGEVQPLVDRLLSASWIGSVELYFDRLAIGESASWPRLRATLDSVDGDESLGREVDLRSQDSSRLTITRNRLVEPPATFWKMHTTSGVPLSLLGDEVLDGLGVELNTDATVEIHELAWRGGRIERLDARVTAGAGSASRAMVLAANNRLRCGSTDALMRAWQAGDGSIGFDELALAVQMDATGLRLRGECRDAEGRTMPCVLAAGGAPLLYQPAEASLPLLAVLKFFAPPEAALRPAGAVADAVARRLPVSSEPVLRR